MFSGNGAAARFKAGFTLIEMMAVMLIVALVSSLAVMFIPGSGRAKLKAVTMETIALLRRERLGAIMTGGDRSVVLDGSNRILIGSSGDTVAIPRDVGVDILGVDAAVAGRPAVAVFHPDGGSSGGVLTLSREGVAYEIRVNWYTGGVAVAAN